MRLMFDNSQRTLGILSHMYLSKVQEHLEQKRTAQNLQSISIMHIYFNYLYSILFSLKAVKDIFISY